MMRLLGLVPIAGLLLVVVAMGEEPKANKVDFNRDVRPILSNNCFQCHGPDEKVRKGKLRLDTREGALEHAIVSGKPGESELLKRLTTSDSGELMPPPKTGKKLTAKEIATMKEWIVQGAPYAKHWSYEKPVRPAVPALASSRFTNPTVLDKFLEQRLLKEGLAPQLEADRSTLIRRVAMDLTGLPPTVAEVDEFLADKSPNAYEKMVDRFLAKPSFGEHWARQWLDLARYADSAGYADDPARTIWAYRDYVIRSFNANKPFDKFTVEQIAGDMLPNATEEQIVATAFHRNTLTNSEGGTNDEEFRNVAVVDRVNTTLAVWMGTSMACAQCHTHKYDPITQKEYFQFFAFLNNTEDADRGDESPLVQLFTEDQRKQKAIWEAEQQVLLEKLKKPSAAVLAGQTKWEASLPREVAWKHERPAAAKTASGAFAAIRAGGAVFVSPRAKQDTYTITTRPLAAGKLTALQLTTEPPSGAPGNYVITAVKAALIPTDAKSPTGRYVRIELPGADRVLSLAEVQVFSSGENIALKGTAKQNSTGYEGVAKRAIDGNTNGEYFASNSVTHNAAAEADPWWEVDLKSPKAIEKIVVWNRTDGGAAISARLSNFKIALLDDKRQPVWEQTVKDFPNPSTALELSAIKAIPFVAAYADYSQAGFEPEFVLKNPMPKQKGWAVGGAADKPHTLTLITAAPVEIPEHAQLVVTIEQNYAMANHTLEAVSVNYSTDPNATLLAPVPPAILAAVTVDASKRTAAQTQAITDYYLSIAPELKADREKLATVQKSLADLKPATTVPIFRELPKERRRVTKLQFRGNFMDLGEAVTEGVPSAFHPLPAGVTPNRLAMAQWLVSPENPLTARVVVNRFWESIFGVGIVRTSEEFGSQGELPLHPELLDWLAVEFRESGWDVKKLLKMLVTTAAYKQSSKVTPQSLEKDPDNRLLSRGPRFRPTAETVRDQALAVSGLLSAKMYGPSVKPPQPSFGLNAAFGRSLDWQTSMGEDRYRRGLYTEWRRTNPYPSMAAFDAPSRESCTIRRLRSNTPLQALVTLNDPVYIEAAQALARKMAATPGKPADQLAAGFRACVSRSPNEKETARLLELFTDAKASYSKDSAKAMKMATDPLGPLPKEAKPEEVAAWTVVANVLLNLDEFLMRK